MPSGGRKGGNIALIVEILAATLTGGALSAAATPLCASDAPHPELGQFLVAIDPAAFGDAATTGLESLVQVIEDAGERLPGARRHENRRDAEANGLAVSSQHAAFLGL